jgi:hypothetical protein
MISNKKKMVLFTSALIAVVSFFFLRIIFFQNSISDLAWQRVSESSTWGGRDAGATVVHNGRIYLLGGWTFEKKIRFGMPTKSRFIYRETVEKDLQDIWSSTDGLLWERTYPPWENGMYGMAASFNGALLYMGGLRDTRQATESISSEIWSSKDGANWRKLVDHASWGPRIGSTLIEHEGKLWIFGVKKANNGHEEVRLNDVWSSSDGINWKLVTQSASWAPRAFHCAASFRGKMWVIGGGDWDGREARADVWESSDGFQWTRHKDAPWIARIWHSCQQFDGGLWVLGGRLLDPVKTVAEAWITRDGESWESIALPKALGPRHAAYSTVFNGKIWWLGGSADNYLQTDSWTYLPSATRNQ